MAEGFDGIGKYFDLPGGKMTQCSGLFVDQKYIVGRGV